MTERKKRNIKFLGGVGSFDQDQLNEAVRAAAGRIADPSTPKVTPKEREALKEVFGALGLTTPDDPQQAMGGRTMSHNSPLDY